MADTKNLWDDDLLEKLSNEAWEIYNRKLKAVLEPEYLGKIVAIHHDTEDYEVGTGSSQTHFALRARHPQGMISTLDIGPVDPYDTLSLRMMSKHFYAGQKK